MRIVKTITFTTALTLALCGSAASQAQTLGDNEQLGKSIFFDKNLSINGSQSCASCHSPDSGWTGPTSNINLSGAVYESAITGRFGNRKPPSSAYITASPIFHIDKKGSFVGGAFWDGRATGETLGNPAADQAQGPFLNPTLHASPDSACIVYEVCTASYPRTFTQIWGANSCVISWPIDVVASCASENGQVTLAPADRQKVEANYDRIALSISAFEASSESNAYSSKYDAYLAGLVDLSKQESRGLKLFKGKAKCANCHSIKNKIQDRPLFTNFRFANIGLPRNPDNPWYTQLDFNPYGLYWIDQGLGGFLDTRQDYQTYASTNLGKHKVPTLRNVDKRPDLSFTKAYGHNGYFKSLKRMVHFYNTRDVKPACSDKFTRDTDAMQQNCWPEAEVVLNRTTKNIGNLRLSESSEDDIVAFLKTLSDGYQLP